MSRYVVIALVLISVVGCTTSQQLTHLEAPTAEVPNPTPIDIAPYLAKYASYDGVIVSEDHTIEHSGIKDDVSGLASAWIYSEVYRKEYIVLNPHNDELTSFEIGYKPDKLFMRVAYPTGAVNIYGLADLQEIKNKDGDKDYKFAFPAVEKGTVITIGYEANYDVSDFVPPLEHQIALQHRIPCEKLTFTYAYPDWWDVQLKQTAKGYSPPVQVTQKPEAKKTLVVYSAENVPALRWEQYSPPFLQTAKYLHLRVRHLVMNGAELTPRDNWDDLLTSVQKYNLKKQSVFSERAEKTTDSLVAGITAPRERLQAIIDYIPGVIQPYWDDNEGDPGKTLQLRRGSIFDVVSLARAMIIHAGLTAEMLLVHDAEDGYFDQLFVSVRQIHYPALRVGFDSTSVIVFPYMKYLPVGQVPPEFESQEALGLDESNYDQLTILPASQESQNRYETSMDVVVDSSGMLTVNERRRIQGDRAFELRNELADMSPAQRVDTVKSLVQVEGADLKLTLAEIRNDTVASQPLELRYDYIIDNLVSSTGDEMVLQAPALFASANSRPLPTDTAERQNPIWIPHNSSLLKDITLHLPSGWLLEQVPAEVRVENQFGSLSVTYGASPDSLVIHQAVHLTRGTRPRERYGELLQLLGSTARASIPALIFKRAKV